MLSKTIIGNNLRILDKSSCCFVVIGTVPVRCSRTFPKCFLQRVRLLYFVVVGAVHVVRSRMFPNCFLSNACVYCTYTVVLIMMCIVFKRFAMSEIAQTTAACAHDVKRPLLAQAFLTQAFPCAGFPSAGFFCAGVAVCFLVCSCLYFDRNSFLDVPEAFTPQALSQGAVPPKALTKRSPNLFNSFSATVWTLTG